MFSPRTHGHQEFLLIKQDDKFFSRLLSKEKSKGGESSLRFFYYGGSSGSIPFHWESQPGTPKHALADSCKFNPPLTPPPSFHSSSVRLKSAEKQSSKLKLFPSIFPRKSTTARFSPPPPPPPPFSSSPAVGFSGGRRQRARSDFLLQLTRIYGDDHQEKAEAGASPTSHLCSGGVGGGGGRSRRSKGFGRFYHVKNMKRALLSVVGHGSA